MRPRVFVALPLGGPYLEAIKQHCEVEVFLGNRPISQEELVVAIADVDGVLGSAQLPFPADVLDQAPRLRVISNIGVGFDNVDIPHASRRGVMVTNTPGVLTDAVADLVLGLMIIMARRMRECAQTVREARWAAETRIPLGTDLKGKTLAIVGFGRIGREVAARALSFKMRVLCFDVREGIGLPEGIGRAATLDEALSQGDFVSLHVNLNESTRHLIGAAELGRMKPSAFLINAARGSVVDQQALFGALCEKRIAGAGLDVLEVEPPDPQDPLLQLENVFIVPHIGRATIETRLAMLDLAIRNLVACVTGEPCDCVVNPEAKMTPRGRDVRQ